MPLPRLSRARIGGCLLGGYLLLLAASHLRPRVGAEPPVARLDPRFAELRQVRGDRTADDSVRLAYRELGSRDSARTPVLLIHGSPGDGSAFDGLTPRLAGLYRVLAPDLPGFGASSPEIPDYSNRAHAGYLLQLLDRLGIREAHIAAQSMGGGVALHVVHMAPERVKSLTMISAIGVEEAELLGDHQLNHAIHGAQLAGAYFVRHGIPHFGSLDNVSLGVSYARNFYDSDQSVYRDFLTRVECPTLIIHGRRDVLAPIQAAREHHRLVPQSEFIELDDDHFFLFRRSEQFAPALIDFLDRVESGSALSRKDAEPDRLRQAAEPFDPRSLPPFVGVALAVTSILIAGATLVSEDLACVAAGVLVAQGRLNFLEAAAACVVGIYAGDVLLFLTGRWLGRPMLGWAPVRRFVPQEAVGRASQWLNERGSAVILLSRFTPGLRLPTYLAAGMLNTSLTRFSMLLLAADLVWTPILVGLSAVLGREVLRYTGSGGMAAFWTIPLIFGLFAGGRHALPKLRRLANLQSFTRTWRRRLAWEFWPAWLAYIPVVIYIVVLGIRHRCLTLFTAANPGIACGGGLAGESKSEILRGLSNGGAPVARYARIRGDLSLRVRQFGVLSFLRAHRLRPPFVMKPDVGERGRGVKIVRSFRELMDYLESTNDDVIVQEYVAGWEFGVFYYRFPGSERGKILSVTHKAFPWIVGDGKRTIEDLIRRDSRASLRTKAYLQTVGRDPGEVPARGERLPLIEVGSHCRGAIFLDGSHVITPQLEREFDRISANFPGFYFGRFDVRTSSISEFRQGRGFKILELNGVSAEATHVYDPAIGVVEAYRTLFGQWRVAFDIGAANRARGRRPLSLCELVNLIRSYAAGKASGGARSSVSSPERPTPAPSAA